MALRAPIILLFSSGECFRGYLAGVAAVVCQSLWTRGQSSRAQAALYHPIAFYSLFHAGEAPGDAQL
jgi:hypothetical protein